MCILMARFNNVKNICVLKDMYVREGDLKTQELACWWVGDQDIMWPRPWSWKFQPRYQSVILYCQGNKCGRCQPPLRLLWQHGVIIQPTDSTWGRSRLRMESWSSTARWAFSASLTIFRYGNVILTSFIARAVYRCWKGWASLKGIIEGHHWGTSLRGFFEGHLWGASLRSIF